jgi:hypothetical protein
MTAYRMLRLDKRPADFRLIWYYMATAAMRLQLVEDWPCGVASRQYGSTVHYIHAVSVCNVWSLSIVNINNLKASVMNAHHYNFGLRILSMCII